MGTTTISGELTDVETLSERAHEGIAMGPVPDAYGADLSRVIFDLNQALATELVCVLRYKRHHFTARDFNAQPAADEFLEHADRLATRISQLGGEPDFDPDSLSKRSHTGYNSSLDLEQMIAENVVDERVAISSYTEIIAWLGEGDPTTGRMLEEIVAVEEEHADDMRDLLGDVT